MKRLDCTVQDYAWGDPESIPRLLGVASDGSPAAELWMGAHPKAPSRVVAEDETLDAAIAADPDTLLGRTINARFGQLPYLFKVLAAAQPLSIQTHPSLDQAKAGYGRENAAGVDIGAPSRTYRDPNHKPELICALTPFAARVGFRPVEEAAAVVAQLAAAAPGASTRIDELASMLATVGSDAEVLQATLGHLLGMEAPVADELVRDVCDRAASVESGPFVAELDWVATMHKFFPADIGIAVALLLNHVELQPGEAVFLPAGNLHAYLRGTGMELMANSDNVVRGGLTPKHIDIDELLAVVDATPLEPQIQRPSGSVHTYASPVPEFALTRLVGAIEAIEHDGEGPRIVISTAGDWHLSTSAHPTPVVLSQGDVVFIGDDDGSVRLAPMSSSTAGHTGHAEAFIAAPGVQR